jgi:hypothetical protein
MEAVTCERPSQSAASNPEQAACHAALTGDVRFVVVAAHFVPEGVVSSYSESVLPLVEGSDAARALQQRCGQSIQTESSQQRAMRKCGSGRFDDSLGGAFSQGCLLPAADGSGAWFKCLLQNSQVLTRPGSCTGPVHFRTLLMQEFRPEVVHTFVELVAVLTNVPGAFVVLHSAAPADLVNAVIAAGALACLVPKRTVTSWDSRLQRRAARAVTDAIQCMRGGQTPQAAVHDGTDCSLYYDLVLPPCKCLSG